MDKEVLLKAREFLLNMDDLDIPSEDKFIIARTIYTLFDPENFDTHVKSLGEKFNDEIKWRNKR